MGGGPGGWDNVWLLTDPVGHRSELAKRLVGELGVKVPFKHSDRGFAGPLEDIWNIKSANVSSTRSVRSCNSAIYHTVLWALLIALLLYDLTLIIPAHGNC